MTIKIHTQEELIEMMAKTQIQAKAFGMAKLVDWCKQQKRVIAKLEFADIFSYNRGIYKVTGELPRHQQALPVIEVPKDIAADIIELSHKFNRR